MRSGFETCSEECTDYHFHELEISLNAKGGKLSEEIKIDKVIRGFDCQYHCVCHWSTIKVIE